MQKLIAKKGVQIMKNMFFWKLKNLILSAEHHSVDQKQGSRGSVAIGNLYARSMKIHGNPCQNL
jgi:hypothetical protein